MHVFIAGVMQAERHDEGLEDQSYRSQITALLREHIPAVRITDPYDLHPNSVTYSDDEARTTFRSLVRATADADLLIAYLPLASMGTAMEMWHAHLTDTYIVAVTPFAQHWAIRHVAQEVLPDLAALRAAIAGGGLLERARTYRAAVDGKGSRD